MGFSLHERPQSPLLLSELPKRLVGYTFALLVFGWMGTIAGNSRYYWTAILILVAFGSILHFFVVNKPRILSSTIILFLIGICCCLAVWQILQRTFSKSTEVTIFIILGYLAIWVLPALVPPFFSWLEATFSDSKQETSQFSGYVMIIAIIGAIIGLNIRSFIGVSAGFLLLTLGLWFIGYLAAIQGSFFVWSVLKEETG